METFVENISTGCGKGRFGAPFSLAGKEETMDEKITMELLAGLAVPKEARERLLQAHNVALA